MEMEMNGDGCRDGEWGGKKIILLLRKDNKG